MKNQKLYWLVVFAVVTILAVVGTLLLSTPAHAQAPEPTQTPKIQVGDRLIPEPKLNPQYIEGIEFSATRTWFYTSVPSSFPIAFWIVGGPEDYPVFYADWQAVQSSQYHIIGGLYPYNTVSDTWEGWHIGLARVSGLHWLRACWLTDDGISSDWGCSTPVMTTWSVTFLPNIYK
jgi:hypothetical protein